MAEADMELDLAPHIPTGEQIDEDLIDYDEDNLEGGDGDTDLDMSMYLDKLENADNDHHGQDVDGMEILDYHEHDTIITDSDQDGIKDTLTTVPQSNEPYASDEQHETPEIEIPDRTEHNDNNGTGEVKEGDSLVDAQPVTVENEATEEISYEDTTEVTGHVNFKASDIHGPGGGEGPRSAEETENQQDDDEITWEDEPEGGGDNEQHTADGQEITGDEAKTVVPGTISNTRPTDDGHTPEQEQVTHAQTTILDVKENVEGSAELQNEHSAEPVDPGDRDQSGEKAEDYLRLNSKSPAATSQDLDHTFTFPSITVHYRGEDYPLFSATGDGFFSSISILDCSFQELLKNFRTELNEETDANHDLILQIDELGLEFSEAHQDEILSTCTLRQVLEIHELLVKNQDPEGSRCLYTYLTTRPNTSKRYEYLVECATEGKGLDEIIHLFGTTEVTGLSDQPIGIATVDEGVSEQTDGAESDDSAVGEVATTPKAPMISGSDAEHFQPESEYYKEESFAESDEPEGDVEDPEAGFEATGDSEVDYIAQFHKDAADNQQLENSGEQDVEDSEDVDAEEAEDVEEEEEAEEVEQVDFVLGPDTIHRKARGGAAEETRVPENPDPEATADFTSRATPEARLGEELDTQDTGAKDLPEEAVDAVDFAPQTTESSNSHTLHEGSEVDSTSPKSNGPAEHEAVLDGKQADEDELAEIDWRDEPEDAEVVVAAPSTGEKRGRDDESVRADTEQDVKRRRP